MIYYLEDKKEAIVAPVIMTKDTHGNQIIGLDPTKISRHESGKMSINAQRIDFTIQGLSKEFAKLKGIAKIEKFAAMCGFLGLDSEHNFEMKNDPATYLSSYKLLNDPDDCGLFENMWEWNYHITNVNRLFKIYRAISERLPIKDNLLKVKKNVETENGKRHIVCWLNPTEEQTIVWLDPDGDIAKHIWKERDETELYRKIADLVIQFTLHHVLYNNIIVDTAIVMTDRNDDFKRKFVDRKAVRCLLIAIYYDLYRIVNRRGKVLFCTACGLPIDEDKRSDSAFCDKACHMRLIRNRPSK